MKTDRFYRNANILKVFFQRFSTMDFSVLSPDFTKQLEQQLSRLQNEREDIIAQAAQAVDTNIAHINALLGSGEASEVPAKGLTIVELRKSLKCGLSDPTIVNSH